MSFSRVPFSDNNIHHDEKKIDQKKQRKKALYLHPLIQKSIRLASLHAQGFQVLGNDLCRFLGTSHVADANVSKVTRTKFFSHAFCHLGQSLTGEFGLTPSQFRQNSFFVFLSIHKWEERRRSKVRADF